MLKISKVPIKIISFVFLLFASLMLNAQKMVITTGKSSVPVERNMTENEAHDKAENLAIINAIENAFGTYTEQQMDMTIKEGITSYNIYGGTKVRGQWIKTIDIKFGNKFVEQKTDNGIISQKYITCTIKGKVRKSVPKAMLEYEILNAPNLLSRTRSFYNDEDLYVYFKSPVSGFLSIFLEDDKAVYRLLPYEDMINDYESGVPIINDTGYIFFSPDHNSFPGHSVDEIELFTSKINVEYNYIYIIFSKDQYVKPMLENSSDIKDKNIPKHLSIKKFQQWLFTNRAYSKSFQDNKIKISINQK